MTTVECFAPAKINLTLHVTGQRSDGYHLLDSLVVFADVGDRLWLDPGPQLSISVSGPFAQGVPTDDRNLVWRALERAGWTGRVVLEKNLPHGAGIGGGSADAAAVLRSLFGDRVQEGIGLEGALALGADVPVCLSSGPQRMRGIGEQLTRIWPVPSLDLVLVNPGVPVATQAAFRALSSTSNPPMEDVTGWPDRAAFLRWLARQRNDLEATATALVPEVGAALSSLDGADLRRMTGSGSTCFGIFPNRASAVSAAQRIADSQPGWWVHAARTVGYE